MTESGGNHAALMDKVYRHQRHIYDFTRKYYLLGRDRLVRELDARPGERVLEIGCGTARNLIRIAERYPGVSLYGIDASREMLRTAEESVRQRALATRISLAQGYAEEITPRLFALDEAFDHAIFSYSLSMIPGWRRALLAAAAALKPQGLVHIVDFGDLRGLWPPAGQVLRGWLQLFHVTPRKELLAVIEHTGPADSRSLTVFRGRYAFLLKTNPSDIRRIASGAVG